ncbi:MAG: hypothetical protein IPI88_12775 [Chitinophagaceae bacterium]|nr:hypothetical protein [Chitinophagaceae bacterium]
MAFEALIYSLKPSETKELLTKDCLKKLYNLDEMPTEKGAPASFCNPDTYTLFYLGALIGEKNSDENKKYDWWSKWWEQNKAKLIWNSEKGIFKVSN